MEKSMSFLRFKLVIFKIEPPLEMTHSNFRLTKFNNASQLSHEPSAIPIGQVIQTQELFQWKNLRFLWFRLGFSLKIDSP